MIRRGLSKVALLFLVPVIYLLYNAEELRTPIIYSLRIPGSGLFGRDAQPPQVRRNLVAQNEGISQGPWIIDPPLPDRISTKPFSIRFECQWHDELCPERYIVILRGPIIYSAQVSDIAQDPDDKKTVIVKITVPEPGHYELFAWPDFDVCPVQWRKSLKYPFNRGQVQGTPRKIQVTGHPIFHDAVEPCPLDSPELTSASNGRWVSRTALQLFNHRSPWVSTYPATQEYIYQPYTCKRPHYNATSIDSTESLTHILFLGDSVLRGSFCSQIWPQLSPSGKADGDCTFINDAKKYHVSPKDTEYHTPDGRTIGLSFRFMDDKPVQRVLRVPLSGVTNPSHIIANLGLWLALFNTLDYRRIVTDFLEQIGESYPSATVIWRTTTDVAPMIQCFSDKGMTRATMAAQRDVSLGVVETMRARGMRIYMVDAYAMTTGRPEAANDGRHWVIESPDEWRWLPKARPGVNEAERAVMDAVWDVIVRDDELKRNEGVEELVHLL